MASQTVKGGFADGATVNVYRAESFPSSFTSPTALPVSTVFANGNGSAYVDGLDEGARYVAVGAGYQGGEKRAYFLIPSPLVRPSNADRERLTQLELEPDLVDLPQVRSVALPTDSYDTFADTDLVATASGQPYTASATGGRTGLAAAEVADGYLRARAPLPGFDGTALYMQHDLGTVPASLDVEFRLDQPSTVFNAAVAIILKKMARIVVGDAWVHLELHDTAYNFTLVVPGEGGGVELVPFTDDDGKPTAGVFDPPLPLNEDLKLRVMVTGSRMDVQLPNGRALSFSDPLIEEHSGRYIILEPTTSAVEGYLSGFKSFRATARSSGYMAPFIDASDLARAIKPLYSDVPASCVVQQNDLSVTTATTVTDYELQPEYGLRAGSAYFIEGEILYSAATSTDIGFGLVLQAQAPSPPLRSWWTFTAPLQAVSGSAGDTEFAARSFLNVAYAGSAGASTRLVAKVRGFVVPNEDTGLSPIVCQGVAGGISDPGNPLTIHAGSYLRVTPQRITPATVPPGP